MSISNSIQSHVNDETRIDRVFAREIFDSRGKPTVEVEVTCSGGQTGRAMAPSGASKGHFEALELRDGDLSRLGGAGVLRAVESVNTTIARALVGLDAAAQSVVDQRLIELDGTSNCSRLGANAMVAVSLAMAHAAAKNRRVDLVDQLHELWLHSSSPSSSSPRSNRVPEPAARENARENAREKPSADGRTARLGQSLILPLPMVNMISGGLHAGRNLDFQDFLILPVGAAAFRQALEWIVTIYHRLGELLREQKLEGSLVGDEGGYGPRLESNEQAVELLMKAIELCGFVPGRDVAIGLDVASSHLVHQQGYRLEHGNPRGNLTAHEMVDLFDKWATTYPIISIEDPLADHDAPGWLEATKRLKDRVQLIGDDLFVTNPQRFQRLSAEGMANSMLIKVNQIETLSQTFETMQLALEAEY